MAGTPKSQNHTTLKLKPLTAEVDYHLAHLKGVYERYSNDLRILVSGLGLQVWDKSLVKFEFFLMVTSGSSNGKVML